MSENAKENYQKFPGELWGTLYSGNLEKLMTCFWKKFQGNCGCKTSHTSGTRNAIDMKSSLE